MLFTTRINNLVAAHPRLSRIWIKSGDPRTPLKAVWMDESKLPCATNDLHASDSGDESAELDDHLCGAGCLATALKGPAWLC